MNSQNLASWIQILTGIALLVGIVLVVWELQQSRDLVRAQLVADGFLSHQDNQRVFLGESFASTYAKACFDPENLTDAEMVQMWAYTDSLLTFVTRAQSYGAVGDSRWDWERLARGQIRRWLSTKVGRAEYVFAKQGGWLSSWIVEAAEELIANSELMDCTVNLGHFGLVRAAGDPILH